jgi:tripartite ATP-independent transporter DctP family solute receptor
MDNNDRARGKMTRRKFVAGTAALPLALPLFGILSRRADAAEFTYKLATAQDPTHPVNVRAQEAANRIREATNGRLEIRVFPASQLGSDSDQLSQVRSGGVEFCNQAGSTLSVLVPSAGIANTGFAFNGYADVWKAMDGGVGSYIRKQIEKVGIVSVSQAWDNGFRQVSTSTKQIHTPADLQGLKIRVPVSPMLTSVFQSLGAGATPINFNELYSALQTKLVEGQENALPTIETSKIYEVQKYIAMTGHVWDNYWILGNPMAFRRLPPDIQTIVKREFDRSGLDERADIARLSDSLKAELIGKGVQFNDVDRPAFRDALSKAGFYKKWQEKFGAEAWGLLEQTTGKLA